MANNLSELLKESAAANGQPKELTIRGVKFKVWPAKASDVLAAQEKATDEKGHTDPMKVAMMLIRGCLRLSDEDFENLQASPLSLWKEISDAIAPMTGLNIDGAKVEKN